jgi:hypothetical protein
VGADSVTQTSGGQTTQDQDIESVSDIAPSAIHWAIAVLLSVALVGGLLRVARVLQKTDSIISPARHAPDGMRPVQCGACHTMQHVTMHGRIFICFSCHSANRIVMDPSITVSEELPLVSATGPLRRFEFKREGEIYFQETSRAEIDEGEAEQLMASPDSSTAARANDATCVAADTHADNQPVAVVDLEAGETDAPTPSHGLPAPSLIGQQDPELISNQHHQQEEQNEQNQCEWYADLRRLFGRDRQHGPPPMCTWWRLRRMHHAHRTEQGLWRRTLSNLSIEHRDPREDS